LAEPVIQNWVILPPGVEKKLRFSDHRIVSRPITDAITRAPKTVQALEFTVTMEDGSPTS
jgi:hypothetical protein